VNTGLALGLLPALDSIGRSYVSNRLLIGTTRGCRVFVVVARIVIDWALIFTSAQVRLSISPLRIPVSTAKIIRRMR
jgi:hypothetical protein